MSRFNSILTILFLFIVICKSYNLHSQSCLPQGIEFNTQGQIDSFQINYPGCHEVGGELKIKGFGITNLYGLIEINEIQGDLTIDRCHDLVNIEGLDSLKYVGRDIKILDNFSLSNLNGLGGLTSVKRHLIISGDHSLLNLNGLESITRIDSGLTIWYNNNLIDLIGLDSLTYIGYELLIADNSSLTSLNGLNSLVCVKANLGIHFNNSLINLSGLYSLTEVGVMSISFNQSLVTLNGLDNLTKNGGYLNIYKNSSLVSLNALISLNSVDGWLEISENPVLSSLSGIHKIDHNSITELSIKNNASLSTCHVQSICDYLAAPNGNVSIYGNAPGCSSREEVEARCAGGMETGIRVFLQRAYSGNNSMNTNLNSVLPVTQPYDTVPWSYQGSEILNNAPSNMVDWVLVELRDSSDCNIVDDTRAGVLLEDGSIKDTNLINDLYFYNVDTGYYYMSVRHRNHISVMTAQPLFFPSQTLIDFTDTSIIKPYGGATQAQIELDPGTWGMICGDINNDGKLQFSGPGNDRMEIIQQITNVSGLTNITAVINGYYFEDLDLNTEVKYSGPKNDASIIIQNIITLTGSTSINSVYTCPVMFLYP